MTAEEQLQRLAASSKAYKEEAEKEIERLKSLVAKLARENEGMKPFQCKNLKCKERIKL